MYEKQRILPVPLSTITTQLIIAYLFLGFCLLRDPVQNKYVGYFGLLFQVFTFSFVLPFIYLEFNDSIRRRQNLPKAAVWALVRTMAIALLWLPAVVMILWRYGPYL